MERQFNLTLTNRWKSTGVVAGGILLLGITAALVGSLLERYSPVAAFLSVAGLLFGWILWVIPRAALRLCAKRATVVVDDDGLTVQYPATGAVRRIAFADMVSYSFSLGDDLTVRPRQETTLNLHLNYKLHPQELEPFMALGRHFQWAVADYQRRHPGQTSIVELGFLLRPVGTGMLGLLAVLAGWLGWRALQPFASEGAWGGFILVGMLLGFYTWAWLHERQEKLQSPKIMKQEFELTQTNTTKVLLLFFGGMAVLFLVAFQGANLLGIDKGTPALVWFFGIFGAGLVGLYRAAKVFGAVRTLVTVGPDRLLILKTRASEEIQVPYNQIASYRAQHFNGSDELRLTLHDGSRHKVTINSQFFGEQPFAAMVRAFEAAIETYPRPAGATQAVVREPTFFEKPISTVLLVVFTVGLAWMAWMIMTNDRPIRGSVISVLGSYAVYVASWLAARGRRNQK